MDYIEPATGEIVGTITDADMATAVTEVDKAAARLREAKANAKDAKDSYDAACECLTGLARKRFCPDAAPLFDEDDDADK